MWTRFRHNCRYLRIHPLYAVWIVCQLLYQISTWANFSWLPRGQHALIRMRSKLQLLCTGDSEGCLHALALEDNGASVKSVAKTSNNVPNSKSSSFLVSVGSGKNLISHPSSEAVVLSRDCHQACLLCQVLHDCEQIIVKYHFT